jgi:hypothetical protein
MDRQTVAPDHQQPNGTSTDDTPGDLLSRQFVRAMLDDARFTDEYLDALEARIVALEELVATRGLNRLRATRRLPRPCAPQCVRSPGGHSPRPASRPYLACGKSANCCVAAGSLTHAAERLGSGVRSPAVRNANRRLIVQSVVTTGRLFGSWPAGNQSSAIFICTL